MQDKLRRLTDDAMNELTRRVIGAAIDVHRVLGAGLLEPIYQQCLQIEFQQQGLAAHPQYRIPIEYRGRLVGENVVADFFFPEGLIVEIKADIEVSPIHVAQLLTYMKLTSASTGLILNFNIDLLKNGIHRYKNTRGIIRPDLSAPWFLPDDKAA